MKAENNAEISGFLQGCSFFSREGSPELVRLRIYTVHPLVELFPSQNPSKESVRIPHVAVGRVDGDVRVRLKELEGRNLSAEGRLVPCSVLGKINFREEDGTYYLSFDKGGFMFSEKLAVRENNRFVMSGVVESVVNNGNDSYALVDAGGSKPFRIMAPSLPGEGGVLKSGSVAAGESVLLKGLMYNAFVSNGEKTVMNSVLVARSVEKLNVKISRKGGKSL